MAKHRVAPIFQQARKARTEKVKRVGRAEGMIRMREEMRKAKNWRIKTKTRDIRTSDFKDMEIREVKRREASRRMDNGVLRSDRVENKYVQDKGQRMKII